MSAASVSIVIDINLAYLLSALAARRDHSVSYAQTFDRFRIVFGECKVADLEHSSTVGMRVKSRRKIKVTVGPRRRYCRYISVPPSPCRCCFLREVVNSTCSRRYSTVDQNHSC
jgi:hypothetical protein